MPCAGPNLSCNPLPDIRSSLSQVRPGEIDAQVSTIARAYFLRRALNAVHEYFQHRTQRRDLAALNERLLRDVGISSRG
jgi:uncharacterized protein YjiS (DUF1127 family)